MKKIGVILYGAIASILVIAGLSNQSLSENLFVDLNITHVSIYAMTAVGLGLYSFIPSVRTLSTRNILGIYGLSMVVFAAGALVAPGVFGQFWGYMFLGDMLMLVEGGILATVLSLELSVHPSPRSWNVSHLSNSLLSLLPKLIQANFSKNGRVIQI
ncbi:MAG TPA: hypothetical protein VD947_03350 [Patescibacteria group bacterium]|nr:hypothetical protein [Patescibacteria group bacterium]